MLDERVQGRINWELKSAFAPGEPLQVSSHDGDYHEERSFEVGRLDEDYLSVHYTGWGKHRGNSSRNRLFAARTIDLRSGRVLSLRDLFLPRLDYLERLKALARPRVAQALETDPGERFLARDPGFYLTPQKLVLFNLFRDGTELEVALPRAELSDIAEPNGPLGP